MAQPRSPESEVLGWGPAACVRKPSGGFWGSHKSENRRRKSEALKVECPLRMRKPADKLQMQDFLQRKLAWKNWPAERQRHGSPRLKQTDAPRPLASREP